MVAASHAVIDADPSHSDRVIVVKKWRQSSLSYVMAAKQRQWEYFVNTRSHIQFFCLASLFAAGCQTVDREQDSAGSAELDLRPAAAQVFEFRTAGNYQFTVPAGCNPLAVEMWGAGGGGGELGLSGGGGGFTQASLDIATGQFGDTLGVTVGGGGQGRGATGSPDSGDGGGASVIIRVWWPLLGAGGGGGAGSGPGGTANGGAGGGIAGQAGGNFTDSQGTAYGGGSGLTNTPYDGAGGSGSRRSGSAASGSGGHGANQCGSSGAGGGGTGTGAGGLGYHCTEASGGGGGGGGWGGGGGGGGGNTAGGGGGGGGAGSVALPANVAGAVISGSTVTGSGAQPGDPTNPDRQNAGTGGLPGAPGKDGAVIFRCP
jgi:hypothetical protein